MTKPTTMMIDDVKYVREDSIAQVKTGPLSIVRTESAGVHIGQVVSENGQTVVLANAVRLWEWYGAFTLNAVATKGVDRSKSRISLPVPSIKLLNAIEIVPVAENVDLSSTEK